MIPNFFKPLVRIINGIGKLGNEKCFDQNFIKKILPMTGLNRLGLTRGEKVPWGWEDCVYGQFSYQTGFSGCISLL